MEPSGILAEPLKAVEAANKALSEGVLGAVTKSRDAFFGALRKLYSLPTPNSLEKDPFLRDRGDKEKLDWVWIKTGRLIQSSDTDAKIRERVFESQIEVLQDRAAAVTHLVDVWRTESKARIAMEIASKALEKNRLAEEEGKDQKIALQGYIEAMDEVHQVLGDLSGALQRLTEPAKKYAETKDAFAEAIEALVATQTKG